MYATATGEKMLAWAELAPSAKAEWCAGLLAGLERLAEVYGPSPTDPMCRDQEALERIVAQLTQPPIPAQTIAASGGGTG